jgi:ketosteroid isomerase-like protein
MPAHPNVARIRRVYDAFRAGEADTIRNLLADDLVWHIPGRHRFSGNHNKATIMATYEKTMPEFSKTGKAVISTVQHRSRGRRGY